jgi:hypothetical protein
MGVKGFHVTFPIIFQREQKNKRDMSKETYYFSHDYNARTDEKIKLLIRKHGLRGYGIFWAIVEDLYNNANALRLDCEGIAFELREDIETIKSVIQDFDLFQIKDNYFGSLSVQERLNKRLSKSAKARETALLRWNKSEGNANAMQTHSEGNAIKESKVKEKKVNSIDISQTHLIDIEKIFLEKTAYNWTESYAKKEAEKFFNFYGSKGWKVGKEKMKSLPHAIGGWISRCDKPETKKEETEREFRLRTFNERNGL